MSNFSPFDVVVTACIAVVALAVLAAIVLALRTRDELTRAVMSDVVFYGMMCMYVAYAVNHHVPMVYYIVLLAAMVAGILPTLSISRIISKGRR